MIVLFGVLVAKRRRCIYLLRKLALRKDGPCDDPLESLSVIPDPKPCQVETCESGDRFDYYFSYKAAHSKLQSQPLYVAMAIHDVLVASGYRGFFPDEDTLLVDQKGIEQAVERCSVLITYVHDESLNDTRCQIEWTTAGELQIPILCIGDAVNFDLRQIRLTLVERYPCLLRGTWLAYIESHRHSLQKNVCRWLSLNAHVTAPLALTDQAFNHKELPDEKSFHYFLSHKKRHSSLGFQPEALAMAFHDVLQCKGFQGFFDLDNLVRISKQDLENGVKSSCTLIIFLHDETCDSEWCRYEWSVALENAIPILCVVDAKNCNKKVVLSQVAAVSPGLLQYQWLDFFDEYRHSTQQRACTWVNQQVEALLTGGDFVGLRSGTVQRESVHLPGQI